MIRKAQEFIIELRNRLKNIETKLVVTSGEREGGSGKIGVGD